MQLRTILAVLPLLALPVCAADVCNLPHLEGPYGFLLYGTTSISGSPKPFTNLGRVVLDGKGGINGTSSVMFTGLLLGNPVTGSYNEVGSDCKISWQLQDDSGAFQHFSGTITSDGKRVQFQQTDPGGGKKGIMIRTSDGCGNQGLQKRYAFTLTGTSIPMAPGEGSGSTAAEGLVAADAAGNFKLTVGRSPAATDVNFQVDSDCTVQFVLTFPSDGGTVNRPIALRGILVNDAREILAIQTDPGSMVWGRFTAK